MEKMDQFVIRKRAAVDEAIDSDDENKHEGTPQKSKVWKFFEKSKDGTTTVCIKCGKICKTSGNITNLHKHLTRMHPSLQESELPARSGTILPFINKKYEATSQ